MIIIKSSKGNNIFRLGFNYQDLNLSLSTLKNFNMQEEIISLIIKLRKNIRIKKNWPEFKSIIVMRAGHGTGSDRRGGSDS